MRSEIILIGPMGVGKSFIAELLSKKIGKPHIVVDQIRFDYYLKIGFDRETERKIGEEKGFFNGVYRYWKPYELYSIKRILADFTNCIFDFGAGHSVYEDDNMFEKAKEILSKFKNIMLLLPSKDLQESIDFLVNRNHMENDDEGNKMLKHFIEHHSNYDLCNHIIYVKDKTPDDILKEILKYIS